MDTATHAYTGDQEPETLIEQEASLQVWSPKRM